ncbi:hypothetical protein BDY21DRAFT_360290 [Lineolata rhizophorae]|uniref:Uncharacterized protein n=1 Tax=Lineolata rhizophorae TaxID=578093 RepID=A0A6A6PEC4_9PEZI|nr:hypothetical protein BDY21DRAFT_360290 [Lineolata rhizophorae]
MSVPRYTHIISRPRHAMWSAFVPRICHPTNPVSSTSRASSLALDPVFAISIGVAAAALRIRREEREQGRSLADTAAALRRRTRLVWDGAPWRSDRGWVRR